MLRLIIKFLGVVYLFCYLFIAFIIPLFNVIWQLFSRPPNTKFTYTYVCKVDVICVPCVKYVAHCETRGSAAEAEGGQQVSPSRRSLFLLHAHATNRLLLLSNSQGAVDSKQVVMVNGP